MIYMSWKDIELPSDKTDGHHLSPVQHMSKVYLAFFSIVAIVSGFYVLVYVLEYIRTQLLPLVLLALLCSGSLACMPSEDQERGMVSPDERAAPVAEYEEGSWLDCKGPTCNEVGILETISTPKSYRLVVTTRSGHFRRNYGPLFDTLGRRVNETTWTDIRLREDHCPMTLKVTPYFDDKGYVTSEIEPSCGAPPEGQAGPEENTRRNGGIAQTNGPLATEADRERLKWALQHEICQHLICAPSIRQAAAQRVAAERAR
ncbi:hypothetical protein CRI93_00900 [Longimonas halophila]|uniref:Uncharacterized protein n=2 Tax=Longimonas halophila TaxID=1469170 RepID=A0A2H3P478_9BACT|nr:hypothetical protein CRI93_00900 [Longimonas halophila]